MNKDEMLANRPAESAYKSELFIRPRFPLTHSHGGRTVSPWKGQTPLCLSETGFGPLNTEAARHMAISQDKIIGKCLRCGQEHANTVDWYTTKRYRRCPACGGELDFKQAFSEWCQRQSARIQKLISDMEQKKSS